MNRIFSRNLAMMLAVSATALALPAQAQTPLETERQKVSYMIGMDVARSMIPYKEDIDPAIVAEALRDVLGGASLRMTDAEAEQVRQAFVAKLQSRQEAEQTAASSKNLAEGQAFLRDNRGKAGVQTTPTGLQYQVITEGSGPKPTAASMVKVHYEGTLLDGTVFDSSIKRGEPAQFGLGQVIPGWTEGVQLMSVGSKYRFWVPAALAYGERGTPGPIGPNQTLVFEVELLEIVQ